MAFCFSDTKLGTGQNFSWKGKELEMWLLCIVKILPSVGFKSWNPEQCTEIVCISVSYLSIKFLTLFLRSVGMTKVRKLRHNQVLPPLHPKHLFQTFKCCASREQMSPRTGYSSPSEGGRKQPLHRHMVCIHSSDLKLCQQNHFLWIPFTCSSISVKPHNFGLAESYQ